MIEDIAINVFQAEPIGNQEFDSITLSTIPGIGDVDLMDLGPDFYQREATKIMRFIDTLPQGTRDQLLIKLLTAQASQRIHSYQGGSPLIEPTPDTSA